MQSYSNEYDSVNYDPAAPLVEVGVSRPGADEAAAQLAALIDTGADATMLPIDLLQAAGGRYVTTRQMRGVTNQIVTVEMYLVTLFIGPFEFRGIEAIATAEDAEAIVGRDVLNQMIVTLNGLANSVEMSQ